MRSASWLVDIATSELNHPATSTDIPGYDIARAMLHGYVGEHAKSPSGEVALDAYLSAGESFYDLLPEAVEFHTAQLETDDRFLEKNHELRDEVAFQLAEILRDAIAIGLGDFLSELESDWRNTYDMRDIALV